MKKRLIEWDLPLADIRSAEVKARAQSGSIRLSANEWKKARHYGDKFWLYIVTWAANSQPILHCIIDPSSYLQENQDIFATGFIIPEERWLNITQ